MGSDQSGVQVNDQRIPRGRGVVGGIGPGQRAASEGVEALERIEGLISSISESQSTVASAIEEQSAVTAEISRAIGGIADGTRDTAEQTALFLSSMNDVRNQTSTLHDMLKDS